MSINRINLINSNIIQWDTRAIKKDKLVINITMTWMDLKNDRLTKRSQTCKVHLYEPFEQESLSCSDRN